jgi:hypothetical protein
MMRKLSWAAAAAAAALLGPGAASAAVVLFSNFENPNIATGTFAIVATADGWTKGVGTAGIEIQDHVAGAPAPTGGDQFVELDSNSNSTMYYDLAAGGTFKIDFLYSPRPGVGPASNPISVYLNNALLSPPGTVTGGPLGATSWMSYSTNNFSAAAGSRIEFRAEGTNDSLGGYVDNITISTAPEPSSWAMMLVGFGGLGGLLRRRRAAFAAA